MKKIRVEKRIPFGFKGEWGQVYKSYVTEEKTSSQVILWGRNQYVDIGQDVQFKYLENGIDKQRYFTQTEENIVVKSDYRIVETTDAYFDDETGEFECVVDIGDVIYLFGRWWVVDNIDEKSIFTPAKQTFFYLGLKRIKEEIIRRN